MTPTPADLATARAVATQVVHGIFRATTPLKGYNFESEISLAMDAIAQALQAQRRDLWEALAEGLRCSGSALGITAVPHPPEVPWAVPQAQRRDLWEALAEGLRCSGSALDITAVQHAHELPWAIQQAQRERLCNLIREQCKACGGSGYGAVRYNKYGGFVEGDECMYCGVPIAAIRASGQNHEAT